MVEEIDKSVVEYAPGERIASASEKNHELMRQIASGDIKQKIETPPFSDALQALEKVNTRHALGKVAITLADNN